MEMASETRMAARIVICRSNPVAPDPRVAKTARTLAGQGYSVQIVCWDRMGMLTEQDKLAGSDEDILIHRLRILGEFGHGLGNLPGLLRWQWGLLHWLATHRHEYDLIHACDFDTVLPAWVCKLLWKKGLVYDIFDFYADHLRATPEVLKKMIRWIDLWMIGKADAVILADDSRREQIASARPKRLEIIYNSPESVASIAVEQKATDSSGLRLAYVGLLQEERGLFEILAVLEMHPAWELDLAGFGGDEAKILAKANQMNNVHWHGRVAYEEALRLSQAADILFATYDPAIPNHRYSSPNKLFEAMLLSKPIIVSRDTNMDRIVERLDCGVVVEYGDVTQLDVALTRLYLDKGYRTRLGENGQRAYEAEFSWAIMQSRLIRLYATVTG